MTEWWEAHIAGVAGLVRSSSVWRRMLVQVRHTSGLRIPDKTEAVVASCTEVVSDTGRVAGSVVSRTVGLDRMDVGRIQAAPFSADRISMAGSGSGLEHGGHWWNCTSAR